MSFLIKKNGHIAFIVLASLKQLVEKLTAEQGDDGYLDARIKFLQHQVNMIIMIR